MDAKRWIVFVIIVAAVIGGMVYMSMQNKLDISDISNEKIAGILPAEPRNGEIADNFTGKKDAKVVLIEYGDYQCPGCKTTAPKARAVAEKYKDHLTLVFRNFPITSLHPNARAAAAAVEAAGLQGKFWEMHDLVFENQVEWQSANVSERTDVFAGYSSQLGLDVDKFKEDLASEKITKKLDFDVAIGRKNGVEATPAFFIGGKQIETSSDSSLEDAVKEALKKEGVKISED